MPNDTPPVKEEVEKVLYQWSALARPFKRRSREFYVSVMAILSIIGLILFLAEGAMPVILLASLFFLFYILNTVEPPMAKYSITSKGIKIEDNLTPWNSMKRFWIAKNGQYNVLIVETVSLTGRMEYVVQEADIPAIKKLLSDYIPEEEALPTAYDKASKWFSSQVPQDKL